MSLLVYSHQEVGDFAAVEVSLDTVECMKEAALYGKKSAQGARAKRRSSSNWVPGDRRRDSSRRSSRCVVVVSAS